MIVYTCAAAEHVQKYIDGHDLTQEFDESVVLHTKVCVVHLRTCTCALISYVHVVYTPNSLQADL